MATGAALINSHCLQALVLLMFSSKYLADFVMKLGVTRAACTRVHHDRDLIRQLFQTSAPPAHDMPRGGSESAGS